MTSLKKILVIGDVMLDKYWHSSASASSAEAPTAAVIVNSTEYRAGGAANVALNIKMLANLQTQISLLAPLGQDADGNILKSILNKADITTYWVTPPGQTTITKHRIIADHQQLVRVDFEQKYSCIQLNDEIKKLIAEYHVIIISDYDKGTLEQASQIITYARELDKIILVDPKGNNFAKYKNAHLLTPNLKEFTNIVGDVSESDMAHKAYNLIAELNLDNLLVTLGANGMTLFGRDSELYHACSYADHVYDVTGAGDTVIASLAVSLAEGTPINDAVEYASHAAALVVSQLGTSHTTRQAVKNHMANKKTDQICHKYQDKIVKVSTLEQFHELLADCLAMQIPVFSWSFIENNILTAPVINALADQVALMSGITKICLVVTDNLAYSDHHEENSLAHNIDELVYMLSLLDVTAKIRYSNTLDLAAEQLQKITCSKKSVVVN